MVAMYNCGEHISFYLRVLMVNWFFGGAHTLLPNAHPLTSQTDGFGLSMSPSNVMRGFPSLVEEGVVRSML